MLIGYCSTTEYYERIVDIGFDYVEFHGREITALDQKAFLRVARSVEAGRIPCLGFVSSLPPSVAICGPAYEKDAVARYAGLCCERGAALHISHIGIGSPLSRSLPEGFPADLAARQLAETLEIFCAQAQPRGLNILFESVSGPMCTYITRFPEAVAVVERLRLPNLHLVLDLYHLAVMDETLEEYAHMLGGVKHLHIAEKADYGQLRYESERQYVRWISFLKAHGCGATLSVEISTPDPAGSERSLEILRRVDKNT